MKEKKYTTFDKMFKLIPFILCLVMMYPHRDTIKRRLIVGAFITLSFVPLAVMLIGDMILSWSKGDIVNVVRQSSIVGPFLGCFLKILIMCYYVKPASGIIDDMNRDFARYNDLPKEYHVIIDKYIKDSRIFEIIWTSLLSFVGSMFPCLALVLNVYSTFADEEPVKHMAHETSVPFMSPETRFQSPYYEIIFAYMCYFAFFYLSGYTGYDAFLTIAINHARLKMDIYCLELRDALKCENSELMRKKISKIIEAQNRTIWFVSCIQETFQVFLCLILVGALLQIGSTMYLVLESNELDLRYIFFSLMSVTIFYNPCQSASNLKFKSLESADMIYCSGWENVRCLSTRRTVAFMIARAQIPLNIIVYQIIAYDMEIFVAIMKAAYSMYTVLCS